MARPTKMTPKILERLRHAFSIGATDEEACAYADIGTSSLYRYQDDNPEFREEKKRLKRKPILKAKNTIVQSLDNATDAKWYLEHKASDEFHKKSQQEHSGEIRTGSINFITADEQ